MRRSGVFGGAISKWGWLLAALLAACPAPLAFAENKAAPPPTPTVAGPKDGQTPKEAPKPKTRPEAIAALAARVGIGPGSAVADIGAGGGQDSWVFAGIVGPTGAVYAEEVTEGLVKSLKAEAEKRKLAQVRPVLGKDDGPGLPPDGLDLAYMRLVYHHFSKPREMLRGIRQALKPGGHLVVIDERRGTLREWVPREERKGKHTWIAETTVVREAREEGFQFVACAEECCEAKEPFVLIFRRPEDPKGPSGDPDLPRPLAVDEVARQLAPPAGKCQRPVFIALGQARELVKPILQHSSGKGLDIVLEEWATQKDERPPLPEGVSLPSVLTDNGDPRLGADPVDAVFFLDAYHLLFHGKTLLARLRERLEPNGCVYVLDREAARPLSRREASHHRQISPETVKQEMADAGFVLLRECPRPAPDRFLLVFGPKKPEEVPPKADPQESVPQSGDSPRDWLRTPTVSLMTGFIYEPLKPYTVQKWMEGLGNRFDADRWVKDFKETGASHLVFYDKWIDGLVFHDTKTTGFKTKRDFVRELAAACQRGGLPLIFYFNAVSDGNPEFDPWATLDRQGRPIVFGPQWPTRYQTLHSPFRQKAVEQVRELLSGYGPIHGIWHDIFAERLNTTSPWVAQGYAKMYGEPFDKASPARLAEFNARTLAGYLDEIEAIRRQQGQDRCEFTSNGSGAEFLHGGVWGDLVGPRLQYFYNEGHSFAANDELARMAWVLPRPLEIGLLLNQTWFTPLEDAPPRSHLTEKQAIAATAIAVCQGAGVNWALTPSHSGVFGEDLMRAKAAGAWFRQVKPYVDKAQPYADVAIVLGSTASGGPGLPGANTLWTRWQGNRQGAWQGALAVSDALARRGALGRILFASPLGGSWPTGLQEFRAIVVPELAVLDDAHLDQLRRYVRDGGRLIAFGHATLLDAAGRPRKDYGLGDVLGARLAGEVSFPGTSPKAAIKVDSEYNEAFGAHVLTDGSGEAWASGGTPMPHWVEITPAQPVEVERVVLVNRAGPYQVTDFDVEVHAGGQWKTVKSVKGASDREMAVTLETPLKAEKVRVTIRRELYQGQDRQYADLQAVRVIDGKGRDWVGGAAARVAIQFADAEAGRLFGPAPPAWIPAAVRAEPTTAKILATLPAQTPEPAIVVNRVGGGEAYLVTAGDGAFGRDDPLWEGVARMAAGEPTLLAAPEDARRYRFILTRAAGAHVLHVIDSQGGSPGVAPRPVSVSLLAERLGGPQQASLVGSDKPLELAKDGGRVQLVVVPDPVASVVLK